MKGKPLRNPGQSLEEERSKLIEDGVQTPAVTVALLAGVTCLEWWRYYSDAKPTPVLFTFLFFGSIAFFLWRVKSLRPRARALRQGADGERVVGQFLERLREEGYQVFHDLVGTNFNVDHVIIGRAGVFTVETKTWSKPMKGEARIVYDGEELFVGGRRSDRDPIPQARAQASWLHDLLRESTGRAIEVRPVVLFPGWFVEQSRNLPRNVWVLNPKALPGFLEREPERLSVEDVRLVSYHLSRHIRSVESERDVK